MRARVRCLFSQGNVPHRRLLMLLLALLVMLVVVDVHRRTQREKKANERKQLHRVNSRCRYETLTRNCKSTHLSNKLSSTNSQLQQVNETPQTQQKKPTRRVCYVPIYAETTLHLHCNVSSEEHNNKKLFRNDAGKTRSICKLMLAQGIKRTVSSSVDKCL